jgi:hypothetical protein
MPVNLADPNKCAAEQTALSKALLFLDGNVLNGRIGGYTRTNGFTGSWRNEEGNLDRDDSVKVSIVHQGSLQELCELAREMRVQIADIYRDCGSPQQLIWVELRPVFLPDDGGDSLAS